jgi:peptidyl-prolyl cis-trans isomerase C
MSFKTGILLAVATSVLALSGCQKITPSTGAGAGAGVAATVNGVPISDSLVDLIVNQQAASGQRAGPGMRREIVEQLAMQVILAQEAVKSGLSKTPEVADQVEFTRQSILAKAFVQNYFKSNPVGDDALKAEYEKIKARMGGTEYRARHILVETDAEARDVIVKLKKNPKSFEALAKEKSKDPGSRENGGELGWFDPRNMVPEFGAAVAKLTVAQFTEEPVKSQFGYHVILLEESRQKEAPPFEQVKPMLQQQAAQESLKKLLEDLRAKATIEITPTAAAPAPAPAPAAPAPAPAEAGKK